MTLRLMGANPCAVLYDGDRASAYASVWRVDWSQRGSGHALVLGTAEGVRLIGPDPVLGGWLGAEFNRYLSASRVIAWTEPEIVTAPVEFDLDLGVGLHAAAADVTVRIAEPIERYLTRNDAYDLGGVPHILSTVWIPCAAATITVAGTELAGSPRVDATQPTSTAFIADAEVWCTADHPSR